MKKPKISLSKESIVDFFLNHGEKFVVGLFAALACGLVWGGIDAVRTKPAKPDQRPKVIVEKADQAMKHIGESKGPPPETTKRPSIAKQVEPWKERFVAAPAVSRPLNAPLSEEKVKRSQPKVLPLADLRVQPGWAVIAVRPPSQAELAAEQAKQAEQEKGNDKKKAKKKSDPGDLAGGPTTKKNKFAGGMMGGASDMMGGPPGGAMPGMAAAPVADGKLVPYCLVTALVPVTAQQEAFTAAAKGFQMQYDLPIWSDYRVERAEVAPGAADDAEMKWTQVKLDAIRQDSREWFGVAADIAPADLVLDESLTQPMDPAAQNPIKYVLPLPQLASDTWGVEALHPWVAEQIRKRQVEMEKFEQRSREEMEKAGQTDILGGGGGGGAMMPPMGGGGGAGMMPPMGGPGRSMMPPMGQRPGAGSDDDRPGLSMNGPPGGSMPPGGAMGMGGPPMGGMPGMPGMGFGMTSAGPQEPAFRMFRFVDTTVEPGKTYRYRVKISVKNPNYGLDGQYLVEPELAKPVVLVAEWSEPSPPAHVGDKHRFLVRSLKRGEPKKSKAGHEVLVLAENPATGNYAMRSLAVDLGSLLNFDKRQAKGPDAKNAESVLSNGVLLDARGRQDEPEAKKGGSSGPSEPLELLVLREDGSFSVSMAADSREDFDRYASTLTTPEDGKKDKGDDKSGGGLFGGSGAGGGVGIFGSPPGGSSPPAGGPPGGRASAPPGGGPPTGPGGGRMSLPPGSGR